MSEEAPRHVSSLRTVSFFAIPLAAFAWLPYLLSVQSAIGDPRGSEDFWTGFLGFGAVLLIAVTNFMAIARADKFTQAPAPPAKDAIKGALR